MRNNSDTARLLDIVLDYFSYQLFLLIFAEAFCEILRAR